MYIYLWPMALQVQAFDDIGSEIWLLKFCEKLCFNRYVALFHLVWRGFYLLLDVSPVVLLMEPVQDAHLEMYQSSFGDVPKLARMCWAAPKVYCRQIKSSLGSMISTLGSINQSLTMILGASDEEAPDEPPSKRPRTSDPTCERWVIPGTCCFLYFGGFFLQNKAKIPIKTRGPIWVPGIYYIRS